MSGVLSLNGAAQPANSYIHFNNVVSSNHGTLSSATVVATVGLRVEGSGDPYAYQDILYQIRFLETPNVAGTCVAPSPDNNPCSDIWVLEGALNQLFDFNGQQYFVSFFAAPMLAALSDEVCQAAQAESNCVGFTTLEGQANQVDFLLQVTEAPLAVEEVPEPASVALIGAGLLGLAALRHHRRNGC
jgi:hypothetical protein